MFLSCLTLKPSGLLTSKYIPLQFLTFLMGVLCKFCLAETVKYWLVGWCVWLGQNATIIGGMSGRKSSRCEESKINEKKVLFALTFNFPRGLRTLLLHT